MKIALLGYGKMGKMIEQLAIAQGQEIILKITSANQTLITDKELKKADVAIDFSTPEVAFSNIKSCILAGVPVVSGTTGWTNKIEEIKLLCSEKNGAFFYASNFSIGVYIFSKVNQFLAGMMNKFPEYKVEMEEIHHTQKLDAPSGTAITLANQIIEKVERKSEWINASEHSDNQLSILSKRIDKVPGTHTIHWSSKIDTITISHIAHSRLGFATGALEAAKWIIDKKGYFGMDDFINV